MGTAQGVALAVVILSVLLVAVWQLATRASPTESAALREQVEFLGSEVDELRQRLERSRAREVVLEREVSVVRQANGILRTQESQHQAERNRLQAQLDFYRRLTATAGTQSGLDVYRAELAATDSDRVYQFFITLTQNIRRASLITGRIGIGVEGIFDNRPATLSWPELSNGETSEPGFRFRYFQQLEGYLTLPAGFSPTRLLLVLEAGDHYQPVHRSYAWADLYGAPGD
jgi:hypothetical protein